MWECGPVCRDGLEAEGEALGARRGEPRCPDTTATPAPSATGPVSIPRSPTRSSPSWRRGACPGSSLGARRRRRRRWTCRRTPRPAGAIPGSTCSCSGALSSSADSAVIVNHRAMAAAMIDSRDFLAAKKRTETEMMLPPGQKIAVTGGLDFNDNRLIWAKLDQVHAKHPDMVLIHGGSPKGAERIAARWAGHRNVPQIAFKPDWIRHRSEEHTSE